MTQSELKSLFYYNPETGLFTWLKDRGSNKVKGKIAGTTHKRGYIELKINCKNYKAHRLAYVYMNGEYPEDIDHINGVKDDNRISNLRSVSKAINMRNRKRNKNGENEHRNVYKQKNRYIVTISAVGFVGSYITIEEALDARNTIMIKLGYTERTL